MEGPKKDLSTILREEAEERVRLKEEKKKTRRRRRKSKKSRRRKTITNRFEKD